MNTDESLKETGRDAAAVIVEMVAALECDYALLADLRWQRDDFVNDEDVTDKGVALTVWNANNDAAGLKELEEAAGECTSREEAEQRIQEDALSVEMRGDWYGYGTEPADAAKPVEFRILLSTGGPSSRIRGELENGEPSRAWLEVQDWGTPWTQYFDIDQDTLLTYARCFYFGKG